MDAKPNYALIQYLYYVDHSPTPKKKETDKERKSAPKLAAFIESCQVLVYRLWKNLINLLH